MSTPALLWCDIETSGLDERKHYLLEVGFKVTDSDLTVLAERAWVIQWQPILSIKAAASTLVQAMHEASGLWEEAWSDHGLPWSTWPLPERIAEEITDWLRSVGAQGLPLAGSTVGFDRRWLNHWIPGFADIPHYRSVDVSTLKILVNMWAPGRMQGRPESRALHRALPDLDDSIEELRFYRSVLGLDLTGVTP